MLKSNISIELRLEIIKVLMHSNKPLTSKILLSKLKEPCNPRLLRYTISEIRKSGELGKGYIVSNTTNGYLYTECSDAKNSFLKQELSRLSSQYETLEWLHVNLKSKKQNYSQNEQILFTQQN